MVTVPEWVGICTSFCLSTLPHHPELWGQQNLSLRVLLWPLNNLRPGNLAVAFFGDGAMNQGMLMESLNLAVVWILPVLFVCKDNGWAITTRSRSMTEGNLIDRAKSFRMPAMELDGSNFEEVWNTAGQGVN